MQSVSKTHLFHASFRGRPATLKKTFHAEEGGVSLEDQMRSLSVTSDTSSFSLVSRTSRANSFDSVKSIDSQQSTSSQKATVVPRYQASTESSDSTDSHNTILSSDATKSLKELSIANKVPTIPHVRRMTYDSEDHPAYKPNHQLKLRPSNAKIVEGHGSNPAWSDFANFVQSPTASFKSEFGRLAQGQGWSNNQKHKQLVALLSSEVTFYWGADEGKLSQYQELCRDMEMESVPTTITKCKKALKPLKVNLYSVIDHKRNPEISIVQYKSHNQLRMNVRKHGTFPRVAAKAGGGCLSVLLLTLH